MICFSLSHSLFLSIILFLYIPLIFLIFHTLWTDEQTDICACVYVFVYLSYSLFNSVVVSSMKNNQMNANFMVKQMAI